MFVSKKATIMNIMRFQQTDFWTYFKCGHGWEKISAEYGAQKQKVTILCRSFRLGMANVALAYVPMAPEREGETEKEYIENVVAFSGLVKPKLPKNTLCIRFDFPIDFGTVGERDEFIGRSKSIAKEISGTINKNKVDIQPPDTVVLKLDKSEDELLAAMKPKWRYNIRYAMKHGVKVRAVRFGDNDFEKSLNSFYSLYEVTAERDGIGIHPKSYYSDLLERGWKSRQSDNPTDIVLYIASHEEDGKSEDLAAIIALFQKDEAVYLYGCSGNVKRNLMPAYLVQWTAICDARKFGSKVYDFYGIPPTDDEKHPMHGLYLFKTGFGGAEIHRPGSFDVPLSCLYRLYIKAEDFRAWYHKVLLKKIRGR